MAFVLLAALAAFLLAFAALCVACAVKLDHDKEKKHADAWRNAIREEFDEYSLKPPDQERLRRILGSEKGYIGACPNPPPRPTIKIVKYKPASNPNALPLAVEVDGFGYHNGTVCEIVQLALENARDAGVILMPGGKP